MGSGLQLKTVLTVLLAAAITAAGVVVLERVRAEARAEAVAQYEKESVEAARHLRRSNFPEETRPVFLWDAARGLVAATNLSADVAAALAATNVTWSADPKRRSGCARLAERSVAWRYDKDGKVIGFVPEPFDETAHGRRIANLALWSVLLLAGGAALALVVPTFMRDVKRARDEEARKTEFVNAVSHDLQTPIGAIGLWAGNLRRRADGAPPPDAAAVRRACDAILAENARLSRLATNLLEFGRFELGTRRYALAAVDLRTLAHETAAVFADGGAALAVDVEPSVPAVAKGDVDAVRRIVANLVSNAVKYAPGGEVRIAVSAGAGGVSLAVLDRGPGLTPEGYRRCFDRFWRGDDETASACGGFGLGLTISRRLARDMDGALVAAPRPGGGAAFTLRLPAWSAARA